MSYAIIEIQEYYDAPNRREAIRNHRDEPYTYDTRAAALEAVEELDQQTYYLNHNQYGVAYRVLDLSKPRNRVQYDRLIGEW